MCALAVDVLLDAADARVLDGAVAAVDWGLLAVI
jgi:hypothetical protein